MKSPWEFKQHGQSGQWFSELLPELANRADDLCVLHGMHTDVPAHPQAFVQMHTGLFQFKRPSMERLDAVRPWLRERKPSRFQHHQPARTHRRADDVRLFLPSGVLPGHAHWQFLPPSLDGQCQQHPQPEAIHDVAAACSSIFIQSLNREGLEHDPHNSSCGRRSNHSNSPSACRRTCPS